MFIAKFNANGVHQWSQGYEATINETMAAVAVDGLGNVVVTGDFKGTLDLGWGNLVSPENADAFIAKFNASGAHIWSYDFGGLEDEEGLAIAADASGNVTVTGCFEETADFGGGGLVSAGGNDVWVASFDANGLHQWSMGFGGVDNDRGRGIALDGLGNPIVVGSFQDIVNFGGD